LIAIQDLNQAINIRPSTVAFNIRGLCYAGKGAIDRDRGL
jgi:hypothetical protein